jgi:DNA-directed RNA polymerase specialized sigma24 family protein
VAKRADLAALVEAYQQPLGAYIYHLVGELELAVVITRDTFLWCRGVPDGYPTPAELRAELYRVATRLALGRLGSTDAARHAPRPPARADSSRGGVAVDPRQTERGLAQAALRDLAPQERAGLLLCDLEQFPTDEAAAIVGVSFDTFYGQLARARAQFRAAYVEACGAR